MNMKTSIVLTTVLTLTTTIIRADFGESFGGSLLGSTVGSFIGSSVSNACTKPHCHREVVEVREVHVPETMPARRKKDANLEAKYQAELDTLYEKKESLEHRIQRLEQELGDVDKAIDAHEHLIKDLQVKKHHTGREVAEITVE
jgi:peptidoglycan hydrolase CwlO-like protein